MQRPQSAGALLSRPQSAAAIREISQVALGSAPARPQSAAAARAVSQPPGIADQSNSTRSVNRRLAVSGDSQPQSAQARKKSDGYEWRLSKIVGTIERAKIHKTKMFGKLSTRCVVKGMRSNSSLITLFETEIAEGSQPKWEADWFFDCTKRRTREDFIGLKFQLYDGEEFLGGADFEISEMTPFREKKLEVEIVGVVPKHKIGGAPPPKSRMWLTISVERKHLLAWDKPAKTLLDSMRSYHRVTSLSGRIIKATGLKSQMGKKSKPMCVLRCFMMSGRILTLHNTKCSMFRVVDPDWSADGFFYFEFEDETDQPLMVILDIWGSAGKFPTLESCLESQDHMGSVLIPMYKIKDEEAFEKKPVAFKLPLMDSCQVVERFLGREGDVCGATPKEDSHRVLDKYENHKDSHHKSRKERLANLSLKDMKDISEMFLKEHFSTGRTNQKTESRFIYFEAIAGREQLPMPYESLLDEPEGIVIGPDDMNPELQNDGIESFLEPGFQRYFDNGAKRIGISAHERIFTVYGRLEGALDLISADFMGGKSDPYVIVEALTTSGQFLFMYRTRTIQNELNPKWNEWFFFQVPPDPDDPRLPVALSAVQFTIMDCDEGDAFDILEGSKEGDDLLGRASVDVSYMRNTDYVQEELPLLGIKAQPGGYVNRGGFRRYSTISVEVRVERRIMRVIDPDVMPDPNLMKVPRHNESREFPVRSHYKDLSQEINEDLADHSRARDAAGKVLNLRESSGGLLAQAHRRARPVSPREMMAPPPVPVRQRPKSACSLTKKSAPLVEQTIAHRPKSAGACRLNRSGNLENFEQKLQQSQADPYDLDFVGRGPPAQHMDKSGLPILHTHFGNPRYHELTTDHHERAIAGYVKQYHPPTFHEEREQRIGKVLQNLTNRPSTEHYKVHRPIPTRPATAPARRMTLFPNDHDGPSLARHWEPKMGITNPRY